MVGQPDREPERPNGPRCIMIIAGEASGDRHGAGLVKAMRAKAPGLFFCGIGGEALETAGVRIRVRAADLAVVGITEIITRLPHLLNGLQTAKRLLQSLHPDLLILIDFPDFNLRIANVAKKLGIPVLYYISPQIWAWRKGRVKQIKERVDHMAVILPFEKDFYEGHGVPVTFVGHPLVDDLKMERFAGERVNADPGIRLALLPGSRQGEIRRHIPVMLGAARILKEQNPRLELTLSAAPTVSDRMLSDMVSALAPDLEIEISCAPVSDIFVRAQAAVIASGTATLEAALCGMPMVVIYRVSPVSAFFGRLLIKGVKFISLANLIAGRELVPELIQEAATPQAIAQRVGEWLVNPDKAEALRRELLKIRTDLGREGAARYVAEIALGMLGQH